MKQKDKDKNGDEENYEDNDENKETQKEKDEDKEKHKDKDMERTKDNNGDNEKRNDKDNHEDCLVLSESNATNQIKRKVLLVKLFFSRIFLHRYCRTDLTFQRVPTNGGSQRRTCL